MMQFNFNKIIAEHHETSFTNCYLTDNNFIFYFHKQFEVNHNRNKYNDIANDLSASDET